MILFLNFAPIEFMGGAERWIYSTAKKVNKKEKSTLLSVDQSISNIYSKFVLKRKFDKRIKNIDLPYLKITPTEFIPFTKEWMNISNRFKESKMIYSRFELQELILIIYFSGLKGLRKTTFGLHSPLIYKSPITAMDRLHNRVYTLISKPILSKVNKVHVLNSRDKEFLSKKLKIKNVIYIPNGVPEVRNQTVFKRRDKLNILFVGELSQRKGADILLEIAKKLPTKINLTIAGDGLFSNEIIKIAKKRTNIKYVGFIEQKKLMNIYSKNDILLLPSRAESMPLSILEALSHGLFIIDSVNISLNLGEKIEYSVKRFEAEDYMAVIELIFKTRSINKKIILKFFNENFTEKIIDQKLQSTIFNL